MRCRAGLANFPPTSLSSFKICCSNGRVVLFSPSFTVSSLLFKWSPCPRRVRDARIFAQVCSFCAVLYEDLSYLPAVGYKSVYNFPISVHEEAKLVNSKAYHANIAAGRLHEAYAQSLSGPDQLAHHNAAEHHYAAATGHLRKAHKHSAEVDKHRANAGGRRKPNIRKLKKATEKAEKSLEKARNLHQQAELGHSLMVAAQEHRVTEAAL
ncbi:hypothetical protein M413DRAFT_236696 [Hebeloma cylindrosporum]|uniref:Uncharacterized protein n=1 Tax=Hebeloma cylindrosporum TaxID=76867 RepID=A0A0C2XNB9_HEBCY|nr:hypothetical protein M413DRAFT_236696 [Hebeloma cylindrosporum h7]